MSNLYAVRSLKQVNFGNTWFTVDRILDLNAIWSWITMPLVAATYLRIAGTIHMIEFVVFIVLIIVPIVAVWRWSLLGVFIGTLTNETIIILGSLLTNKLKGKDLNHENYEAWWVWAIYMLMYCFFIWVIKCVVTICLKLLSR